MTRRVLVPLHNGPGWGSPRGRRVAALLHALREDVDALARDHADVADGVIVVGAVANLHALLGPEADAMAADARAAGSGFGACMFRLDGLCARIELTQAGATETVAHLRRVHAARGAGRAIVVADGDGVVVAKVRELEAEVDVEAEGGELAVVRGGDA